MSDTATDGASAPVASPLTLKSSDTSAKAKAERAPAPEPKAEPVEAKAPDPKPDAAPSDDRGGSDADDSDAPTAEAPRNKQQQRLPRWMQERLERERQVTRERTRAEVLAEIQRTQPAAPAQPTTAEAGESVKTLEDFDFDPARYTEYLVEQKLTKRERERQAAEAQREAEAKLETFKARVDTFEARAGAGAWEDIATSPLNTDPAFAPLVDGFMGDDHDLDIAHHLAQHLDEARHLLTLSPLARARELTKLADRFGSSPAAAPKAPAVEPKTVTQAPPPPSKLGSGKPAVDINSPQISTADRIAAWKKARAS